MAYQTNVDYAALIDQLKKQMAATTDQAQLAALQSQLGAATQSRTEKIASDLNTYGKYADSSTLDSAANLMATRSIGSSYDGQTQQANTYYDQARQNASNAALSRGMARSSYVQDRMANLDVQRANALTGIDRAKGDAIYNAKNSILENYRTNTANALANEKNEFAKTIGAYSNDYAAEINKVTNDGDASNDWKLPYLQAARNEKIEALRQEALKAAAAASSGGGSGYSSATFSKLDSDMQDIYKNNLDVMGVLTEAGKQRMVAYLQQYGGQYGNQLAAKWIPGDYSPIQNASTFSNTTGQYRFDNAGTLFSAAEYNGFAQRVGMNRTKTGQLTEIMNAAQEGKITDAQAQALLKKYGISY